MTTAPPLFDPFKALAEIRREEKAGTSPKLSPKLSQTPAKENDEQKQSLDVTFATFATFAGPPDADPLAHPPAREEERKNNSDISYTYASYGTTLPLAAEHSAAAPAKVAKVANFELSHCDQTKPLISAAAKVSQDGLRNWLDALAVLSPERPPCPGYRPEEWARTLARALAFLATFGGQAEALGWTASRLFGVHPTGGIVRVDHCGALVLPVAGPVRAITATEISFGHLTHREKPSQPRGVPIWEVAR
jgi:hypothetical protein